MQKINKKKVIVEPKFSYVHGKDTDLRQYDVCWGTTKQRISCCRKEGKHLKQTIEFKELSIYTGYWRDI